jgi:hypothetical protein
MRFSVGVNYWPRGGTAALWDRFDAGEIGADFAHIAALALDTVRVFLRWDRFAPEIDRVDSVALDRLAALLSLAQDAGLQVMPVLFSGAPGDVDGIPAWARDPTGPGAANIYRGPLLEAQLRLASAAAERVGSHPALRAWDIGHRFSSLRRPSAAKVSSGDHSPAPADEATIAAWSRSLCAALRTASAAPATAGTHSDDLAEDRAIRLGSLCAPFAFASMQGEGVRAAFTRSRLDPELLPFLAMLTAGFSFKPVLISGVGNPTCPPGKFSAFERFPQAGEPPNATISPDDGVFATYPCFTEDENAFYCTNVLERLHADGRLGAYWWGWTDTVSDARARRRFDDRAHEDTYGIVRVDGSEKPVAAALSAFARQRRDVVPAADMPAIASAYYYRTLPTSARTLYEGFLRFVSERRTALRA